MSKFLKTAITYLMMKEVRYQGNNKDKWNRIRYSENWLPLNETYRSVISTFFKMVDDGRVF
jgi:hypothetical protein